MNVIDIKRTFKMAMGDHSRLRLYRDGHGVTHIMAYDEDGRDWYRVCDVNHTTPGDYGEDDDALNEFPTCIRCMTRIKYP